MTERQDKFTQRPLQDLLDGSYGLIRASETELVLYDPSSRKVATFTPDPIRELADKGSLYVSVTPWVPRITETVYWEEWRCETRLDEVSHGGDFIRLKGEDTWRPTKDFTPLYIRLDGKLYADWASYFLPVDPLRKGIERLIKQINEEDNPFLKAYSVEQINTILFFAEGNHLITEAEYMSYRKGVH